MDAYLKRFVDFCKEYFQTNLIALVMFGSRVQGYYSKNSDYDIFIIVKRKGKEKELTDILRKKFSKIRLPYFQDIHGLWSLLKEGRFSVYFVLFKTGKTIYSTPEYTAFKNKLKNYKPDKNSVKKRYSKIKYNYELKEAKKLGGFRFIKWIYLSIRKRFYFISYARQGKSDFNFLKELEKNKDLFSEKEIKNLKILHEKTYKRDGTFSQQQRKQFVDLFKKVNGLLLKT